MKIIEEIQSDVLLAEFQGHYHYGDIADALSRNYCYRIYVYGDDFDNILINSSTEERELALAAYPTLHEVISQISTDASFFNKTRRYGMLSGTRVKEIYDAIAESKSKPDHFFLVNTADYPGMNEKASLYVRDGMHHLVAYGLVTNMSGRYFPIVGYCMSSEDMGQKEGFTKRYLAPKFIENRQTKANCVHDVVGK